MMKRKFLFVLFALTLMVPVMPSAGNGGKVSAATKKWDPEQYGKVIDIGPRLRKQAEDEDFQRKMKNQLQESAEQLNGEAAEDSGDESGSTFTFEGPTKYFMAYDSVNGYYIKPYTLRGLGENVAVWVANDLSYPENSGRQTPTVTQELVNQLIHEFDTNIFPKEIEFFGQIDSHTGENALLDDILRSAGLNVPENYYAPIEGKERVILLVDNVRDENYYNPNYPFFVAGFYTSAYETYIDRNIVTLDTYNWAERLESTFFGTLAHEFQHLIHDDNDSDETTWLNEGMSDFAEFLVGYGHPMSHVNFFLNHPENSLVSWDEYVDAPTGPETLADYGQAYLLVLYLYDHFGKEFIQALARDTANGITSVDQLLLQFKTGLDFTTLFRNFTVALHVDSPKPGKGIYNFKSIDVKVNYESAAKYQKEGVPAWGADYIQLDADEKIHQISFDGIEYLPVKWQVVQDPLGAGHGEVLWSNNGNLVDNELILQVDLSGVDEATLAFDHYKAIEQNWDFGFVQVSTDGGHTWTSLANEHTTSEVAAEGYPLIKENVPGFTGVAEGWQHETFDLSQYAGQEILLSFRYMTDWSVNEAGWFIDNIAIPEVGFYHNGSSTEPFVSLSEVLGNYVEYQVSFINEKQVGKNKSRTQYKVLNIDPFHVTEEQKLRLKKILSKGQNYMIVWFPADVGVRGAVDYSYDVITKQEMKEKKKEKRKQMKKEKGKKRK